LYASEFAAAGSKEINVKQYYKVSVETTGIQHNKSSERPFHSAAYQAFQYTSKQLEKQNFAASLARSTAAFRDPPKKQQSGGFLSHAHCARDDRC
jgi:sucrose-6-phosphate hydrolase SacC (GH32 family)